MNFAQLYAEMEHQTAVKIQVEYEAKLQSWNSGNKRLCHCLSGYGWLGCLEATIQCG